MFFIYRAQAKPTHYLLIIDKNGRYRNAGLGASVFTIGRNLQFLKVPATINRISFVADQITSENQGINVNGFAVWKITDPIKSAQHFDFLDEENAIFEISESFVTILKSAIRHQVANLSIDDVVRKRGTLIKALKEKELTYVSEKWGIEVDTVEIENVQISSSTVFKYMQTEYRNRLRRESETSSLKADAIITEEQKELDIINENQEKELELLRQENEFELFQKQQEKEREKFEIKKSTLEKQKEFDRLKQEHELQNARGELEITMVQTKGEKEEILTRNLEDNKKVFLKKLPIALEALSIDTLNITPEILKTITDEIKNMLQKNS